MKSNTVLMILFALFPVKIEIEGSRDQERERSREIKRDQGRSGSRERERERERVFSKDFMSTFHGWGSTVSRLQSHYEETGYSLPLSPQEFLVLI